MSSHSTEPVIQTYRTSQISHSSFLWLPLSLPLSLSHTHRLPLSVFARAATVCLLFHPSIERGAKNRSGFSLIQSLASRAGSRDARARASECLWFHMSGCNTMCVSVVSDNDNVCLYQLTLSPALPPTFLSAVPFPYLLLTLSLCPRPPSPPFPPAVSQSDGPCSAEQCVVQRTEASWYSARRSIWSRAKGSHSTAGWRACFLWCNPPNIHTHTHTHTQARTHTATTDHLFPLSTTWSRLILLLASLKISQSGEMSVLRFVKRLTLKSEYTWIWPCLLLILSSVYIHKITNICDINTFPFLV